MKMGIALYFFGGCDMVYLLKFGASWVLPPGIFILALFVLSWWLFKKRGEKRAAAVLFALTFAFYLLCTGFVAEKTMGWLESAYQPPEQASGDVIIMLGGGAYSDTPDVDGTGTLCASPASRLLTAGQVYEDTGAEAKIAKRVLMSLGVPEEKILTETKSINTSQNARFSAEILRENGLSHPILVTSAFHMKRSVLNFQKQGVAVEPFPTDYLVAHHPVFHYTKLRPQTEALLDNVTVLQETLRTFVTRYIE